MSQDFSVALDLGGRWMVKPRASARSKQDERRNRDKEAREARRAILLRKQALVDAEHAWQAQAELADNLD